MLSPQRRLAGLAAAVLAASGIVALSTGAPAASEDEL
jgi:hypothetical protein